VASAPRVEEIPFADFQARLRLEERRIPIEGTLEPTFRCNLNCVHCYVNQPAGSRAARRRELPAARILTLIDEMAEAGCLNLLLTGGEPLLRPDFPALYLHAVRRGLLVSVFTNGTLVTDRIADLLADARPERVEVTLYGMTAETSERITRTPGSFEPCLAGIRRLTARRLPLALKTMVLAWNRHEVAAMRAFATHLGADFTYDCQLNTRVDGGANRTGELQLTADEAVDLDRQDPDRLRELRGFCRRFVPKIGGASAVQLFTCGAGQTAFTVDPSGMLQLCQLARRSGFDLRQGSFAEGWGRPLPHLRARRWTTAGPCRSCSLISLCGSCPGAAELAQGDPESPIARFCEIAHRRAFAAMGAVDGHRADASCCLGHDAAPSPPPLLQIATGPPSVH
jgi:radical SAM protein with 4Fe4S-binding SPASM domain